VDGQVFVWQSSGQVGQSCHGMIENSPGVSQAFRDYTKILFDKYFPIERSATLTREEKIPLMHEWCVLSGPLASFVTR
jgi:Pyrimidine 5'-nucleotidase (UMPH-1)